MHTILIGQRSGGGEGLAAAAVLAPVAIVMLVLTALIHVGFDA